MLAVGGCKKGYQGQGGSRSGERTSLLGRSGGKAILC